MTVRRKATKRKGPLLMTYSKSNSSRGTNHGQTGRDLFTPASYYKLAKVVNGNPASHRPGGTR